MAMIEPLVQEYGDRIYRFVRRMTGPAWADDLTQETFLQAFRALSAYRGGRQEAWLFSIANHVCVDFLRRRRRESRHLPEGAAAGEDPAERLDRSERRRALLGALAELPVEQRQVFLLREEGSMTFREIAEATGVPLGTALARMRYALEFLRRRMSQEVSSHGLP
jgi:RNA polymerase sigma-70 factor (ECF subfamily)